MVEKYIKELLFEQNCLIVPGFGGFIANYNSATIHPITHKISPPSRSIAFNEQVKFNDGLLISAVASGEGLTKLQAQEEIQKFADSIFAGLKTDGQYSIPEIGKFLFNKDNHLEFIPANHVNFLPESFGLPEIILKPIARDTMETNIQKAAAKPGKAAKKIEKEEELAEVESGSKRLVTLAIVFPVFMLVGAGLAAFFVKHHNDDKLTAASLNPLSWFSSNDKSAPERPVTRITPVEKITPGSSEEAVVSAPSETSASEESAVASSAASLEAITEQTGRYYIILGCFSVPENAAKLKDSLKDKESDISIIAPTEEDALYKVSVADFDNLNKAIDRMVELRATYGNTIWVKKF